MSRKRDCIALPCCIGTRPTCTVNFPCPVTPQSARLLPLLAKYLFLDEALVLACTDRRCQAVCGLPLMFLETSVRLYVDKPRFSREVAGKVFTMPSTVDLSQSLSSGGTIVPLSIARPLAHPVSGHAVRQLSLCDVVLNDAMLAFLMSQCPAIVSLSIEAAVVPDAFAPTVTVTSRSLATLCNTHPLLRRLRVVYPDLLELPIELCTMQHLDILTFGASQLGLRVCGWGRVAV